VLLLVTFTSAFLSFSQECDFIHLSGQIKDTTTSDQAFVFQVKNISKDTLLKTNINGSFEGTVSYNDTLLIEAFGYEDTLFIVPETEKCQFDVVFNLKLNLQVYKTINVYKVRKLGDLKEERSHLEREAFENTAMGGPISSMYSMLNKKEQNKRKLVEIKYEDKKNQILKNMLLICLKEGFIEMPNDKILHFIRWMNISDFYFKNASNYDLLLYLKDAVRRYKVDQNLE
jgi:hypothetical protein